jgi:hypothetical protein
MKRQHQENDFSGVGDIACAKEIVFVKKSDRPGGKRAGLVMKRVEFHS